MIFFTPGPVATDSSYLDNFKNLHHRDRPFMDILTETRSLVNELVGGSDSVLLTGSGTSGMEAVIKSVSSKCILFLNCGKFGDIFLNLANTYDKKHYCIKYDYGDSIDVSQVVSFINKHSEIDMICLQGTETSTGIVNDVDKLSNEIRAINSDILIVLDAICHTLIYDTASYDVDIIISASQKSFMQPAGVVAVTFTPLALSRLVDIGYSTLSLKQNLELQQNDSIIATPAVNTIVGMNGYLKKIKSMGKAKFYDIIKLRALAFSKAFSAKKLNLFAKNPSIALTVIECNDSLKIKNILREDYGVCVASGQNELTNKLIRITNIGILDIDECIAVVDAIEHAFADVKVITYDGTCKRVFKEVYSG